MKPRRLLFRMASIADRLAEPVTWLGAAITFLLLLYLLIAPPVLLTHARQTGSASFPGLYGPVLWLIESDFGGPMLWYFNSVWHAELILIGEIHPPAWYMVTAYALVGGLLLLAMALPFLKLGKRRAGMGGAANTAQPLAQLRTRASAVVSSGD